MAAALTTDSKQLGSLHIFSTWSETKYIYENVLLFKNYDNEQSPIKYA